MKKRYFKKPNNTIIIVGPQHDIKSLDEIFVECDADGNELKKEKPKVKPKASKKKEGE